MRARLRPLVPALALLLAAACAGAHGAGSAPAGPAVPSPEWRVGDRWVFRRTALGGAPAVVTHEVVRATPDGYVVRLRGLAGEVTREWTRDLALVAETASDGAVGRYAPPLQEFTWPLPLGHQWSQAFTYTDPRGGGRYTSQWRSGPAVEPVDVLAGRFYTIRVERWAGTQRVETYWYNARVRYWVRLEDYLRGYVEELAEFAPWGS